MNDGNYGNREYTSPVYSKNLNRMLHSLEGKDERSEVGPRLLLLLKNK